MNDLVQYVLAIGSLSVLCAGWIALQYAARSVRTKNHLDHAPNKCGQINAADAACSSGVAPHHQKT